MLMETDIADKGFRHTDSSYSGLAGKAVLAGRTRFMPVASSALYPQGVYGGGLAGRRRPLDSCDRPRARPGGLDGLADYLGADTGFRPLGGRPCPRPVGIDRQPAWP